MRTNILRKNKAVLPSIIALLMILVCIFGANAQPILTLGQHNVSCAGGSDGSVHAKVSGGTLPFSYSWSNGASGRFIAGLSAGVYSVTVTDGNGLTASGSVSILGAVSGSV